MNDTPGWASPGSAPSDRPAGQDLPQGGQEQSQGGPQPADQVPPAAAGGPADPADAGNAATPPAPPAPPTDAPPDAPPGWSSEQPPPAPWPTPGGHAPAGPLGQPPPPPMGPGWGGGKGPGGSGGAPGWGVPGAGYGPGGAGGYGPGGYGPGGYGHPGWGGWQGRPPAAKPGVIPLRPLGVGEILDGAVSTMRTYWRTVLGITLSVAVVTQIALVLLQGLVIDDTTDAETLNDPSASLDELTHAMRGVLIGSGLLQLVTLLGMFLATALLTTVTSRAVLGRPVTVAEAWRDARPQLPRLLGLTLVLPLLVIAIVVAFMLPGILIGRVGDSGAGVALVVFGGLGGAVLAIWVAFRFALASPALMLEKQSVVKSLSRSAKLVKGSWWRVFGIQLLAAIIAVVVSAIILVPFSILAGVVSGDGVSGLLGQGGGGQSWTYLVISGIGSVVGSMLTFPITAGVAVLLYIDQRIRREALDLELGRAAGVPGYGHQAPGAVPGG